MRRLMAVLTVALLLGVAAPVAAQAVGPRHREAMRERVEWRRIERLQARQLRHYRAYRMHRADRLHRRAIVRAQRMRLRMLNRARRWERRI